MLMHLLAGTNGVSKCPVTNKYHVCISSSARHSLGLSHCLNRTFVWEDGEWDTWDQEVHVSNWSALSSLLLFSLLTVLNLLYPYGSGLQRKCVNKKWTSRPADFLNISLSLTFYAKWEAPLSYFTVKQMMPQFGVTWRNLCTGSLKKSQGKGR